MPRPDVKSDADTLLWPRSVTGYGIARVDRAGRRQRLPDTFFAREPFMTSHYALGDFGLFINIVETSSLTRGAEKSCLSLPAASHRLKNLEDDLGTKLLHRSAKGVSLTDAGKVYLKHAKTILAQVDALTSDMQTYARGHTGRLRILANTTAITEYLPPVLGPYLQTHPDVQVDLRERMSDDIIRAVREGLVHLGIVSGDVITAGLQRLPLTSGELVAIAPMGHEVGRLMSTTFKEILQFEFVGMQEENASQQFFLQAASDLHVVESGAGISIVPRSVVERLNVVGHVAICKLTDDWAIRQFQICALKFEDLPGFGKDLVQALLHHFAQHRSS
jgi:DNA-binding transcriptional LysR family regulator